MPCLCRVCSPRAQRRSGRHRKTSRCISGFRSRPCSMGMHRFPIQTVATARFGRDRLFGRSQAVHVIPLRPRNLRAQVAFHFASASFSCPSCPFPCHPPLHMFRLKTQAGHAFSRAAARLRKLRTVSACACPRVDLVPSKSGSAI